MLICFFSGEFNTEDSALMADVGCLTRWNVAKVFAKMIKRMIFKKRRLL